jgi:hypothetical protein
VGAVRGRSGAGAVRVARPAGRALLAVRWPRSAGLAVVEVVVPFATRYAKRAAYYRAEIIIVAIVLWLRTDLQDTT